MMSKKALLLFLFLITFILIIYQSRPHGTEVKLIRVDQNEIYEKPRATTIRRQSKSYQSPFNALYVVRTSKARLDELFQRLTKSEEDSRVAKVVEHLNLLSFKELLTAKRTTQTTPRIESQLLRKRFANEISLFLDVTKNEKIEATQNFVDHLSKKSDHHSFEFKKSGLQPGQAIVKNESKPIILTISNSNYYGSLQKTVFLVHRNFPDYKLVVYDIGLTPDQYNKTKRNCKCELRKFDFNSELYKSFTHLKKMKVYAWKPLIIQQCIKEFSSVFYVDSSVRLKSNRISEIWNATRSTGIQTSIISGSFKKYTNPKVYEWFGPNTNVSLFDSMNSMSQACLGFFHETFESALIMKAWVTCALHLDCIAPEGSSLHGNGRTTFTHRYDQTALNIVSSFFYDIPNDLSYKNGSLSAIGFTEKWTDHWMFDVKRHTTMEYFV